MKSSMKSFLSLLAVTAASALTPVYADGTFRPTNFKVTFYEVGVQNSSSGSRSPIFQNTSGEELDIANAGTQLFSRLTKPANGTYDQIYVLVNNSVKINGADGTGCFTRGGATSAVTSGEYAVTTNNAALRGEATTTETGFGGVGENGPVTPRLIGSINGSVRTVTLGLVSSTNPVIGGGGTINRYLYTGDIGKTYRITDSTTGTIAFHFDTSSGVTFQGTCARSTYGLLSVNLAIETNAEQVQ